MANVPEPTVQIDKLGGLILILPLLRIAQVCPEDIIGNGHLLARQKRAQQQRIIQNLGIALKVELGTDT